MNFALLNLAWGIFKTVISEPIVNTALDNWTKGTSNKVDDWVWAILEQAAGIEDETARTAFVQTETQKVQAKYDESKAAGEVMALKESKTTWDVAAVYPKQGTASSNIG
jgi:hypothetical protein